MTTLTPKILAFDVFGTVVDWHGSIVAEMARLYPQVDGNAFALAWREGYRPAMARVMSGELGWTRIDELHRMILDDILPRFGLQAMPEAERRLLNRVWHRLNAWPDVVPGLMRLKQRHVICTLSNGNIGLLTHMARHAQLPWDCVLSAEVMMVAAHQDDLAAARACGLLTAYIERPLEFGAGQPKDVSPEPANTLHARDFLDLADQLGA